MPYEELFHHFAASAKKTNVPNATIGPDDGSQILFSSGTSGPPKAVLQSQRAWTTNAIIGKNRAARSALITKGIVKGDGKKWTLEEKRKVWKELGLPDGSNGPIYVSLSDHGFHKAGSPDRSLFPCS